MAPVVIDNVNNKSEINSENTICFTTPIENDVTVNYYNLTIEKLGNGFIETVPKTSYYENNTNVNIEAIANEGWKFERWENDLSTSNNQETILMDTNKNIKAIFIEEAYKLTTNIVGNGNVSATPESTTYSYGSNVTISANPDTGWFFDRWEGDLDSYNNNEIITMNSNKTVTAVFSTGLKLRTQVIDATCSESFDGKIELDVLGGMPPFNYQWNTNAETKDLSNIKNGTYNVTVTDANGLTANTTAAVGIVDSIAPSINSIEDQIEPLNTACKVIVKDYSSLANISDNCNSSLVIEQEPTVGTEITETTSVIITATDSYNNISTITFNIIPEDTTPPVIIPIDNQIINKNEMCTVYLPDYSSLVQVTDNCSTNINLSQIPAASTVINENTEITIIATDRHGNESTTSFMVVLEGDPIVYYIDNDGDGFGVDNVLTNKTLCQLPNDNYSLVAGDCDDNDPSNNPNTNEEDCGTLNIDNNNVFDFRLFPNPANEKLIVRLQNTLLANETTLSIFDALGREISTINILNKTLISIDLNENYQDGVYLIKITNEGKTETKRFVILR